MKTATWLDDPEDHDFPAAASFLSLVLTPADVAAVIAALKAEPTTAAKAKDLLRASRLPELGEDNRHVHKDLHKITEGTPLSPLLIVRGDLHSDRPLVIADGYHRLCAAYLADEDTEVLCRIVTLGRD